MLVGLGSDVGQLKGPSVHKSPVWYHWEGDVQTSAVHRELQRLTVTQKVDGGLG